MADYGSDGNGVFVNFSHHDVVSIESAQDFTAALVGVIGAATPVAGPLIGITSPETQAAIGLVAAGFAATIAIHKVEFQENDKGNGVHVSLGWWFIALGWWGALVMQPLPPPSPTPPPAPPSPPIPTHGPSPTPHPHPLAAHVLLGRTPPSGPPTNVAISGGGKDGKPVSIVMSWR